MTTVTMSRKLFDWIVEQPFMEDFDAFGEANRRLVLVMDEARTRARAKGGKGSVKIELDDEMLAMLAGHVGTAVDRELDSAASEWVDADYKKRARGRIRSGRNWLKKQAAAGRIVPIGGSAEEAVSWRVANPGPRITPSMPVSQAARLMRQRYGASAERIARQRESATEDPRRAMFWSSVLAALDRGAAPTKPKAAASSQRTYEQERDRIVTWIRTRAPESLCLDSAEDREALVLAMSEASAEDMFDTHIPAWTDVIVWVRDTEMPYCLDSAEDREALAKAVLKLPRREPNPSTKKLKAKLLK